MRLRYITHARSLDELRAEFLSDIHRRLAALDAEARGEKRAIRATAIARAKAELESLALFWGEVELKRAKAPPKPKGANQ